MPRSRKEKPKKAAAKSKRARSSGRKAAASAPAGGQAASDAAGGRRAADADDAADGEYRAGPEIVSAEDSQPIEEPRSVAMSEFFASDREREFVSSMSLDLYRDQIDTRLRAEGVHEYLSFSLSDELFAVSILNIKEIIKPPLITKVPRTENVILGVLSLRGTIVPVVDLRLRLKLAAGKQTRKSRILIAEISDSLAGLLVDEVRQVIRLRVDDIEQAPAVFDRAEAEHISGVGRHEGEMYTLLDLESVVQIDKYIKVSISGLAE